MHQRKVIRDKVAEVLTGVTVAGDRVFPTRLLPLRTKGDEAELPAITVYTIEESVDGASAATAPRELTRLLTVAVDAWVSGDAETIDDAIDAIAEQIEAAMHADPHLGGEAGDSILTGTVIDFDENGRVVIARAGLTYEVTYRTLAPEPPADEDLDDFNTAGATHNLGGSQDEADDAEDVFTVQEIP